MALHYKRYAGLALDPIHVGTGEFQLGRVDNLIVREPGSRIPKIPGTSIAGVTRAYAAMREAAPDGVPGSRYLYGEGTDLKSCAGKGGPNGDDHCGQPSCPICVAFGFSRGGEKSSFQGLAAFTDARILLFPVASGMETWWVTSPQVLLDAEVLKSDDQRSALAKAVKIGSEYKALTTASGKGRMRLGWLSLDRTATEAMPPTINLPGLKAQGATERVVVVADDLFSAVVNDHLEVRTSVSIDPKTGTAAEKALFTAEAIPRTTVFWFQMGLQDSQYFRIGGRAITANGLDEKVDLALKDMETMGVGGLNTRGFGRLRVERWLVA